MQLALLNYTHTTHPLFRVTPQLCWYPPFTEDETESQRGWQSPWLTRWGRVTMDLTLVCPIAQSVDT